MFYRCTHDLLKFLQTKTVKSLLASRPAYLATTKNLSSTMAPKDTTKLLAHLRKVMKDEKHTQDSLTAYIIPSCDAHNSEYLAPIDERRRYITGFTGSAGTAIVTTSKALLWTDGRYHLQAEQEMDDNWTLMKEGLPDVPSQADWLCKNVETGSVGADPMLMSSTAWATLADRLDGVGVQLVAVDQNLVDVVWSADTVHPQPDRPDNHVFPLELKFTGRTWQDKIGEVRRTIALAGCSCIILSALDDVAWMYNLRGSDIEYNPVFFSYAAVTATDCFLFINSTQVDNAVRTHLKDDEIGDVRIEPYTSIKDFIQNLNLGDEGKICFSDTASQGLVRLVKPRQKVLKVSPVALMKAVKNPVEIEGFTNCHIRDGAAVCQYLCWLEGNVAGGQVTEITGADRLEKFRAEQEHFMGLSFPTISSVGPNGAIIHYRPEAATARTLTLKELYLCDSGAQYKDGTTDITRTVHLGTPTDHEKECFTRVLKGQIGLASAVFPSKIKGNMLDTLARIHLWEAGLDYLHGTGHGVGSFLNVHEGPMGISFRVIANDPGLQPGMILSDEPGYYEDGNFGIRLETLVRVVETETKHNFKQRGFLTFEPVTLVPVQAKMIMAELMTSKELDWLNAYHQSCRDLVGPHLRQMGRTQALNWLIRETQPIG